MYFLTREKAGHSVPQAIRDKVAAWRQQRQTAYAAATTDAERAAALAIADPLTAAEREQLTAYEYALGRPAIVDGDITVPAGWGRRALLLQAQQAANQAGTLGPGFVLEERAAKAAALLGCEVATFQAATPEAPPVVDRIAARRARVAEYEAAVEAGTAEPL
jgi:hypothetical protein